MGKTEHDLRRFYSAMSIGCHAHSNYNLLSCARRGHHISSTYNLVPVGDLAIIHTTRVSLRVIGRGHHGHWLGLLHAPLARAAGSTSTHLLLLLVHQTRGQERSFGHSGILLHATAAHHATASTSESAREFLQQFTTEATATAASVGQGSFGLRQAQERKGTFRRARRNRIHLM